MRDSRLRITIGRDSGSIAVQINGIDGQPAVGTAVIILPESATTDVELANSMRTGTTDESGRFVAMQVPPGKYFVLATDNPPSSRILYPAILDIDKTPENLNLLLRARTRGSFVDVTPSGSVQVPLVPKDLK